MRFCRHIDLIAMPLPRGAEPLGGTGQIPVALKPKADASSPSEGFPRSCAKSSATEHPGTRTPSVATVFSGVNPSG